MKGLVRLNSRAFLVEAARRRTLVTCDRGQILVPAGDGHVELVLVGEVDGAHRAARRRRTETAAWHATGSLSVLMKEALNSRGYTYM